MTYAAWLAAHDATHAHCQWNCEHPQPFVLADGRLVCGRCAVVERELVEMIPCSPDTCEV